MTPDFQMQATFFQTIPQPSPEAGYYIETSGQILNLSNHFKFGSKHFIQSCVMCMTPFISTTVTVLHNFFVEHCSVKSQRKKVWTQTQIPHNRLLFIPLPISIKFFCQQELSASADLCQGPTPPKFNHLFLVSLLAFPKNSIKICP